MAEWKPYQIAAAGEIAALAESASALADTVKETLTLANLGLSAGKLLAQLQNINPLLIALDALADEVLEEIANLKGKIDCLLVLAWNFFDEIKKKNSNLAHKFISIKDIET